MNQLNNRQPPEMDVAHVAHLVRMKLTAEETEQFGRQLGRILEYVDHLKSLDVSNVEPTAHAVPIRNVLRDDEPAPGLSREEALAPAPLMRQGLFIVPKIIE
jgi:aspartyl-tRNA(Asn)/glutamyl-tRNA(Gln) amidotransferase subunit C